MNWSHPFLLSMGIFASFPYIAWCAITESQCTIAPQPYPATGTDFIFLQQNRKRASVSYVLRLPALEPSASRSKNIAFDVSYACATPAGRHVFHCHLSEPSPRSCRESYIFFSFLRTHTHTYIHTHTHTHLPARRNRLVASVRAGHYIYPSVRLSGDHVSGRMNEKPTFRRS